MTKKLLKPVAADATPTDGDSTHRFVNGTASALQSPRLNLFSQHHREWQPFYPAGLSRQFKCTVQHIDGLDESSHPSLREYVRCLKTRWSSMETWVLGLGRQVESIIS